MSSLAGLLVLVGQLLDAATLTALGASDDARAVPHLVSALDRSLEELARFPAALPPPDLEDEIEAALVALERLEPEAALARARLLASMTESARLSHLGWRVAARASDPGAVRVALTDYFDAPEAWRLVLGDAAAASDDVRLRDLLGLGQQRRRPTNELFRTTLLRRLGDVLPSLVPLSLTPRDGSGPVVGSDAAERVVPETKLAPAVTELELTRALADAESMERYAVDLGRTPGRNPDALAVMYRFHQRYPRRFLRWLDAEDDALRDRVVFVMALAGDTRRLPLLIELVHADPGPRREAAFRGLSEMELGDFDKRLHRLAGDPSRYVRLETALALVPTGEAWAFRLLVTELEGVSPSALLRARRAVERLPAARAIELASALVSDKTATPFAIELLLDLEAAHSHQRLWEILAPRVAVDEPSALLAAARLEHPAARAAVRGYLGRR